MNEEYGKSARELLLQTSYVLNKMTDRLMRYADNGTPVETLGRMMNNIASVARRGKEMAENAIKATGSLNQQAARKDYTGGKYTKPLTRGQRGCFEKRLAVYLNN